MLLKDKFKGKWSIVLSLVLALVSVFLIFRFLKTKEREFSGGEPQRVVIAKTSLSKGISLTKDLLSYKLIPQDYIHPNAIPLKEVDLILSQPLRIDIKKGQLLLWENIGIEAARGGLSELLSKNERALTLAVDQVSGVAGLIRPNDRVDILGSFTLPNESKNITTTLMQNVTILAVGHETGANSSRLSSDYATVTLRVSPVESEILVFAEERGRLRMILRGRDDWEVANSSGVNFLNLLRKGEEENEKRSQRQQDERRKKGGGFKVYEAGREKR